MTEEFVLTLVAALIAGVNAVLAFKGFALARRKRRALSELSLAEARTTGDAIRGSVTVRGHVVATETLTAPGSARPAVYFDHLAEQLGGSVAMGQGGQSWDVVGHVRDAIPFEIDDGRGRIWVDPEGAQFELGLGSPVNADGYRFTEVLLQPGDEIVVSGEVEQRAEFEPSAGYRGTTQVTPVIAARRRGLSIVRAVGFRGRGLRSMLIGMIPVFLLPGTTLAALFIATNSFPAMSVSVPVGTSATLLPDDVRRGDCTNTEPLGDVHAEAWVVGWAKDARVVHKVSDELDAQASAAGIPCVAPWVYEKQRRGLIFEVLTWTGTAYGPSEAPPPAGQWQPLPLPRAKR